jgi:hypothetical protein
MEIFTVFSRASLYRPITKLDLGASLGSLECEERLRRIREWDMDVVCLVLREGTV